MSRIPSGGIGVRLFCTLVLIGWLWLPTIAAQVDRNAPDGRARTVRLTITVVDPTGAAVPRAVVTLTGESGRVVAPSPASRLAEGETAFEVAPGSYSVRVSAPGFRLATIDGLRVRSSDDRRTVRLRLATLIETVIVERDRQNASLDARGLSTVLTREQIDALPDDPEDFVRALRDLAPPGAVIRIDGFSGGSMPPKSQILSIRIPRLDSFAAQDHGGLNALSYIDIVTRPGGGRLQGGFDASFRPGSLTARNPLAAERSVAAWRVGTLTLDGPIVHESSSFALSIRAGRQEDLATVRAAMPDGTTHRESLPRPSEILSLNARGSLLLGRSHTLRVGVTTDRQRMANAGVGDFNLAERAYRTSSSDTALRATMGGPLGQRSLIEARVQARWAAARTRSAVDAPTIRVLDAFTSGGAQMDGGARALEIETGVDVDHVQGAHAFRVGVLVESGRHHASRRANYLGTYTFASIHDFNAGAPVAYTRRAGNPEVRYANTQIGLYAQDDFRIARSLLLNYGARFEVQSSVDGSAVLLPRAGLTWSPRRDGRTVIRAGTGVFAEWISSATLEQALVLDGVRQHDVLVLAPAYPIAEADLPRVPSERYVMDDGVRLPRSGGLSVGAEHQATPTLRLVATYSHRRAWDLMHGRNLNPLQPGGRALPAYGNVIQATNGAASRGHTAMLQLLRVAPRDRFELAMAYALTRQTSNTIGAFSLLPGEPGDEWGPVSPAHAATGQVVLRAIPALTVTLSPRWRSGSPYSITTGRDDNGDGAFTDRPAGVRRNSARTTAQWDIGARIAYSIGFGTAPDDSLFTRRVRAEAFVSAQNLTNRPAYAAFGGVIGSPFFGRPTMAINARRIEVGFRVAF